MNRKWHNIKCIDNIMLIVFFLLTSSSHPNFLHRLSSHTHNSFPVFFFLNKSGIIFIHLSFWLGCWVIVMIYITHWSYMRSLLSFRWFFVYYTYVSHFFGSALGFMLCFYYYYWLNLYRSIVINLLAYEINNVLLTPLFNNLFFSDQSAPPHPKN